MKFTDLIVFAHIGLYYPDRGDIFLYAVVEIIVSSEDLLEILGCSAHDKRHYECQKQNSAKIDPGQSRTDDKGHYHSNDHGGRRPHRHSKDHLISVLNIGHIRCKPGDKTRRRKLVDA